VDITSVAGNNDEIVIKIVFHSSTFTFMMHIAFLIEDAITISYGI
jgi:hypothetical protein